MCYSIIIRDAYTHPGESANTDINMQGKKVETKEQRVLAEIRLTNRQSDKNTVWALEVLILQIKVYNVTDIYIFNKYCVYLFY